MISIIDSGYHIGVLNEQVFSHGVCNLESFGEFWIGFTNVVNLALKYKFSMLHMVYLQIELTSPLHKDIELVLVSVYSSNFACELLHDHRLSVALFVLNIYLEQDYLVSSFQL